MTKLTDLYDDFGQSPWLDNLTRTYLRDGTLQRFIDDGVRGVTANPTILAKAIESSTVYDEQFAQVVEAGVAVRDAYWELVLDDVGNALDLFAPLHEQSGRTDGFVSVEVDPALADDTAATVTAARQLHERIRRPNAFVKIPATAAGIPAIEEMIAEGRSINVTLIFSLSRYRQVIDAYQRGLETFAEAGGDVASVHSVASFFVSRVDTEVDRRLEVMGTDAARQLKGSAAVAQARCAYRMFRDHISTDSWSALEAKGATAQRPLWASTSTKNPDYSDTLYVDSLIGPDTVNTMPEPTLAAFEDHGTLERTVDLDIDEAVAVIEGLSETGIDLEDVGTTLERQGVATFSKSFDGVLTALEAKSAQLVSR